MEKLLFAASLLLFILCACIAASVRISLVRYTESLMDSLDAMLAGKSGIDFAVGQETLVGKIQMKMCQLQECIEQKSQESLRQKQLLESMISDISHQVKTPVASLRMYHSFLERDGLTEEKRAEFLRAAQRQADKLEFLMAGMIRMSRLEAGIIKVQPNKNSIYELLAQAVCDAALKAEEKGIDIRIDCPQGLEAYFDPKWTAEAVFNLVDNGIKYTQAGGKLEISAGKTDFFVRICIHDNGKGIAQEHIPQIFQRFYREPELADTEGLGLGLYLAREIVMKQNGFLEVHSEIGAGTQICVNLPVGKEWLPQTCILQPKKPHAIMPVG